MAPRLTRLPENQRLHWGVSLTALVIIILLLVMMIVVNVQNDIPDATALFITFYVIAGLGLAYFLLVLFGYANPS